MRQAYDYWQDQPGNRPNAAKTVPARRAEADRTAHRLHGNPGHWQENRPSHPPRFTANNGQERGGSRQRINCTVAQKPTTNTEPLAKFHTTKPKHNPNTGRKPVQRWSYRRCTNYITRWVTIQGMTERQTPNSQTPQQLTKIDITSALRQTDHVPSTTKNLASKN